MTCQKQFKIIFFYNLVISPDATVSVFLWSKLFSFWHGAILNNVGMLALDSQRPISWHYLCSIPIQGRLNRFNICVNFRSTHVKAVCASLWTFLKGWRDVESNLIQPQFVSTRFQHSKQHWESWSNSLNICFNKRGANVEATGTFD